MMWVTVYTYDMTLYNASFRSLPKPDFILRMDLGLDYLFRQIDTYGGVVDGSLPKNEMMEVLNAFLKNSGGEFKVKSTTYSYM